jgi:F-type H+-transporting ATPase subunit b
MILLAFAESIQLIPDGTLVLHIAIVIAMVFTLNRILYKPINRILDERESRTRGRSGEALGILQRVKESLSSYENSLRQARAESYRLLEQQQAEASGERLRKVGVVRKEVEEQVEEQKREIQAQAEDARRTLGNEAKQAAATISSQILGR